jgi:NitT/TauT family transport system substrate-binding protein
VLIVARKDAGINTLADLKGKKIATPQLGNTQDIAARHYVIHKLHQQDASNILPVPNAEQVAMMARNQIDAAWAPEPWASRLVAEAGAKVIAKEQDLWPNNEVTLTVVVTTPEFLAAHPEIVEKILNVHRGWTAKLSAEPKKYLPELSAALFALTGKKLPPGVLDTAITHVKFTNDPLPHTLLTMAQYSHELGFERPPSRMQRLVDLSILNRLQAAK